jgi:hypothetical protein
MTTLDLTPAELYWLASYYKTAGILGLDSRTIFPVERAAQRAALAEGEARLIARDFLMLKSVADGQIEYGLAMYVALVADILFTATATLAISGIKPNDTAGVVRYHRSADSPLLFHAIVDGAHVFKLNDSAASLATDLSVACRPAQTDDDAPDAQFEIATHVWPAAVSGHIDAQTLAGSIRSDNPLVDAQVLLASCAALKNISVFDVNRLVNVDQGVRLYRSQSVAITAEHANWLLIPRQDTWASIRAFDATGMAGAIHAIVDSFIGEHDPMTEEPIAV